MSILVGDTKSMRAALPSVVLMAVLSGCGGVSGSSNDWYYHWRCNGDSQCLSLNSTGQASGTAGPISGGLIGCNELITFGTRFWNIPPATQSCDNSPTTPPPAPPPPLLPPTIAGFTPTRGSPGTAVTITGTQFATNSTVTINGVAAPVTLASSTQISILIPPMANFSGPFKVTAPGGTVTSSGSFSVVNDLFGVAWSGSLFAAVGGGGTIVTSPDGVTWTSQSSGSPSTLSGVAWSGTQFVTVGASGTILTSLTGSAWTAQPSGTANALNGITWSGTQFATVGASGTILTSSAGSTWSPQTSGTGEYLNGVSWSGSQFLAVGAPAPNYLGQNVLVSPSGTAWTQHVWYVGLSPADGGPLLGLLGSTWSGSQFVAVGGGGATVTSPDGSTWSKQTSGTTNDLYGIAWTGTQFVAVGSSGTILTSPAGVTWNPRTSATSNRLNGVIWSGTQLVAVGTVGTILTSPDGITWTPRG